MPIKSYLARPHRDKFDELLRSLDAIKGCETIPSTNEELIVLVTDTDDEIEDQQLVEKINKIKSLKLLSMVSGFNANS